MSFQVSEYMQVLEGGTHGTLIYSQSVRSTDTNLDLWLASEMGESCGTESIICEIWWYLQRHSMRTELNL